jgi:beta-glucosidase
MDPWHDRTDAIVEAWLPGQAGAGAVVDVLLGRVNPSGKVAETFPLALEDTPGYATWPGERGTVIYGEGVFVGYRWYETRKLGVRFPFGHGLSYGSTSWAEPVLSSRHVASGMPLTVELAVSNTGTRRATDVVQCYVVPLAAPVSRPYQELKAFGKVDLEAGERAVVRLTLDDRAFSYWHTGDDHAVVGEPVNDLAGLGGSMAEGIGTPSGHPRGWRMAPGEYDIVLARSSAEPVHRVRVSVAES